MSLHLSPLAHQSKKVSKDSIIDLESLSKDELKKRIAALAALEDWRDECGHPILLHKGGPCTRKEGQLPDTDMKIWSEFRFHGSKL